jgi:putative adenylate-forming enzyme
MLKKLFAHCNRSPFYQPYINAQNNLYTFPVIDKAIFMSDFERINTVRMKLQEAMDTAIQAENSRDFSPTVNGITVGLSSGTSGNKGVFLASKNERAYWVALMLDRVIGFTLKKRSVAFFLRANSNIYDSVRSGILSFHYFDLLDAHENHLQRLNVLQPTILVGPPSLLVKLARDKAEGRLMIQPSKIISVAEVLSPEDKIYLTAQFATTIHQVYQCTEGFLASSCKEGTLHFNEDFLIIEKKYIDAERKRFHPVITDLKRRSQPIIRYELNDILIAKETCTCNSRSLAIEAIEGRADDVLTFVNDNHATVSIYPDFIRKAVILADDRISDYAVIQDKQEHLFLFIKSEDISSFNRAAARIQHLLKQHGIYRVNITSITHNHTDQGNKLRRVKNEIRKTN